MEVNCLVRPPRFLWRIYSQSIWFFQDGQIRLTFDDGPSEKTGTILDLLRKTEIRGYFFLLPLQAEKYRHLVKRMVAEGHEVGVHSHMHKAYWFKSKEYVIDDLNECIPRVEAVAEKKINIIRSPYGRIFPWQENWLKEKGLQHWFWSLSSVDYKGENSDIIKDRLMRDIMPGDVILFHDGDKMNVSIIQVLEELCNSGLPFEKIW